MGIKHFWKKATAAVAAVVIGMSLFASTSLAAKVTPQEVETTWWSYKQSSASYYTGSPIQTSANIKCPTQTCAVSRTSTATITKGYSTSASTEIKAINVGASFTITKATSAATTYSYTIKKGQAGYVVFYPKKRKSTGTLRLMSSMYGIKKSKPASATSATKLKTGEANGDYDFHFTKK